MYEYTSTMLKHDLDVGNKGFSSKLEGVCSFLPYSRLKQMVEINIWLKTSSLFSPSGYEVHVSRLQTQLDFLEANSDYSQVSVVL